jgi:hypothetical protein
MIVVQKPSCVLSCSLGLHRRLVCAVCVLCTVLTDRSLAIAALGSICTWSLIALGSPKQWQENVGDLELLVHSVLVENTVESRPPWTSPRNLTDHSCTLSYPESCFVQEAESHRSACFEIECSFGRFALQTSRSSSSSCGATRCLNPPLQECVHSEGVSVSLCLCVSVSLCLCVSVSLCLCVSVSVG